MMKYLADTVPTLALAADAAAYIVAVSNANHVAITNEAALRIAGDENTLSSAQEYANAASNANHVATTNEAALRVAGDAAGQEYADTMLGLLPAHFLVTTNWPGVPIVTTNQGYVVATITSNVVVTAPSSPVNGWGIEWWVQASGGTRTITWPTNDFRIPYTSSMSPTVSISNGFFTVFLTKYNAALGKWMLMANVGGY